MEDDMYGLGFCLFEIGLSSWKSMLRRNGNGFIIDDWAEDFFEYRKSDGELDRTCPVAMRHENIIRAAKRLLPLKIGNAYTDIVVTCLSFGFNDGKDDRRDKAYEAIRADISLRCVKDVLYPLRRLQVRVSGGSKK